jgi:hypothetical protein
MDKYRMGDIFKVVFAIIAILLILFYLVSIFSFIDKLIPNPSENTKGVIQFLGYIILLVLGYFGFPIIIEVYISGPMGYLDYKTPLKFLLILLAFFPLFLFLILLPKENMNLQAFFGPNFGSEFQHYFWLFFFGVPISFLVTRFFISSGDATDTSHYWALSGSTYRVRSATIKEVWQKENPTRKRSWDEVQQLKANIIFVILVGAGFLWLLFANEPAANDYVIRIMAFLLACAIAFAYLFSTLTVFNAISNERMSDTANLVSSGMALISLLAMLIIFLIELISLISLKHYLFSPDFFWIPMIIGMVGWVVYYFHES